MNNKTAKEFEQSVKKIFKQKQTVINKFTLRNFISKNQCNNHTYGYITKSFFLAKLDMFAD